MAWRGRVQPRAVAAALTRSTQAWLLRASIATLVLLALGGTARTLATVSAAVPPSSPASNVPSVRGRARGGFRDGKRGLEASLLLHGGDQKNSDDTRAPNVLSSDPAVPEEDTQKNWSSRRPTASDSSSVETTSSEEPIKSWFPITRSEFPHFASMSIMMFLFIYVFTTVRDTKDTLVVSNCGAEAIPFLKLYGVMPCAALFIVMYSKCSNLLGKNALFYATLLPFFAFYTFFAFVLYPMRDTIHFLPAKGVASSGGALASAVNLLRYWSFSLYFIVSELWASAGVPLLFWQCANDVTPLSQAKRFYPLFAVTGNLAPIVSGKVMSFIVSLQKTTDDVGFGATLQKLASIKLAVCLGIIALYKSVYERADLLAKEERLKKSLSTMKKIKETQKFEVSVKFEKKKEKPTLRESIKELSKSRELKSMAAMVLCYNVCIELTEVLWKGILRKTYTNKSAYMSFMAQFSQTVGTVAFVLQLCASGIIRVLGWKWAAMITPLAMVLLAVPFFASVAMKEEAVPLATALAIGTAQNVVSKVTKYSLFDPCKEMAYIPLGPEAKVKGKAAVDVLGARLGRSIGSASQQLLVFAVGGGSIINCAPFLGGLYVMAIVLWSKAVSVLGKLFERESEEKKTDTRKLEKIGEAITLIKSIEDAKRGKNGKGKVVTG